MGLSLVIRCIECPKTLLIDVAIFRVSCQGPYNGCTSLTVNNDKNYVNVTLL